MQSSSSSPVPLELIYNNIRKGGAQADGPDNENPQPPELYVSLINHKYYITEPSLYEAWLCAHRHTVHFSLTTVVLLFFFPQKCFANGTVPGHQYLSTRVYDGGRFTCKNDNPHQLCCACAHYKNCTMKYLTDTGEVRHHTGQAVADWNYDLKPIDDPVDNLEDLY